MVSLLSSYFSERRKLFLLLAVLLINLDLSHSYSNEAIFSTPEECRRTCVAGEEPKICYYKFHIEFYTTVGPACDRSFAQKECVWADGVEKTLLPINRMLPGPLIEVCKGDQVVVDVENAAPGTEVTIHWHGVFQNGYQYYDGVPYITQCPIPSSSTFRYNFAVDNAGTHFYHSHISTFRLDGQSGPLIVKDPEDPHKNLYDDEIVIMLNDWIHELSLERYPGHYRTDLGQIAQNILINGLGNWTDPATNTSNGRLSKFVVKPGLRYRIRIINAFATVCPAEITFHGHKCTVIAQDGADVLPKVVDSLVTEAGERVDCILTANRSLDAYWIQVRGLGVCLLTKVNQLAILQYDGASSTPSEPPPTYDDVVPAAVVTYNGLDATQCNTNNDSQVVCVNQFESVKDRSELLVVQPDVQHVMDFWFFNYTQYGDRLLFKSDSVYPAYFDPNGNSQLISMFNDITFETPSSPLISDFRSYRTICKQNERSTCNEPCSCTQVLPTPYNAIVELVLYDSNQLLGLNHPFHLHGYEFCVFLLGRLKSTGNITRTEMDGVLQEHNRRLREGLYKNPACKDTVKIPQGGYAIVRFKANNPEAYNILIVGSQAATSFEKPVSGYEKPLTLRVGHIRSIEFVYLENPFLLRSIDKSKFDWDLRGWWLIHCHFSWHEVTGMRLVIRVGEQYQLPPKPKGFPECSNWTPAVHVLNDFYGFRYPKPW